MRHEDEFGARRVPVTLSASLHTSSPFSLPRLSFIPLCVLEAGFNGGWGGNGGRGTTLRGWEKISSLYNRPRVTANCTCGWRKCLQAWVILSSAVRHNQARSPECVCAYTRTVRVCVCACPCVCTVQFSLASSLVNQDGLLITHESRFHQKYNKLLN